MEKEIANLNSPRTIKEIESVRINFYCLRDYKLEAFLKSNLQMCGSNSPETLTQRYHPEDYIGRNSNGKAVIKIFITVLSILVKET